MAIFTLARWLGIHRSWNFWELFFFKSYVFLLLTLPMVYGTLVYWILQTITDAMTSWGVAFHKKRISKVYVAEYKKVWNRGLGSGVRYFPTTVHIYIFFFVIQICISFLWITISYSPPQKKRCKVTKKGGKYSVCGWI